MNLAGQLDLFSPGAQPPRTEGTRAPTRPSRAGGEVGPKPGSRRSARSARVTADSYASVHVPTACGPVLAALVSTPQGLTSGEIVEQLHGAQQQNCVARRLRDLTDLGYVEEVGSRPGPSGRPQIVWRAKPRDAWPHPDDLPEEFR